MTLKRLWQAWQQRRQAQALKRRHIPDALWALTLARYPFLRQPLDEDEAELRRLCALFLDSKEFTGTQGLVVTDRMAVAIAAQACLPVLHLGLDLYNGFVGIVVHADEVRARRQVEDDAGIVHEYEEDLTGEAPYGGPVMLSWQDVAYAGETAQTGYNVVIHEFAHVIDMADGHANGVPPLPSTTQRVQWRAVMEPAYEAHARAVARGEDTVLDPYGAEAPEEFFAVASEHFFVAGHELRQAHPDLYELLRGFYRQDPAARHMPNAMPA